MRVACLAYPPDAGAIVTIRAHTAYGRGESWALVLAAGEGSRLRTLTTTETGLAVPKQFCSLRGERSLLDETILRAQSIVPTQRICVIVAAHHQAWWDRCLAPLQPDNVIVQPRNLGTANGILLPLLHILERDPDARIVILPSDHHVQHEPILQRSLQDGLSAMDHDRLGLALLGADPEFADDELGYIVPGKPCGQGMYEVCRFVEKPSVAAAQSLMNEGGLWNVFILIARARALLRLIERQCPDVVDRLQRVVRQTRRVQDDKELSAVYEALPELDFSRHIAQPEAASLRVLRVPQCGWSDLGTPRRVAEVLTRSAALRVTTARAPAVAPYLNLAEQFARFAAPIGASPSC